MTCQCFAEFCRKKASRSGISSTQGGHQVAQKLSSSGLPRKLCMDKGVPPGVSKSVRHKDGSTLAGPCGLHFHRATPAPAIAAAAATPAYNKPRRRESGGARGDSVLMVPIVQ